MALPLKIQTKESASTDDLKNNILKNCELIKEWIDDCYQVHMREALLVSFGTSFRDNPEQAIGNILSTADRAANTDIWTIKHALPLFKDLAVKPKFCVILDPRDVSGVSTLGHVRRDLLEVYPETTYLVATMTHPSVTQFLLAKGAKVVGWHSACEGMKDPEVQHKIRTWVTGGSCSAMRAISLARIFGYRTISLLGCDATVAAPEEHVLREDQRLRTMLQMLDFKLSDEAYGVFSKAIVPAIELYGARKIQTLMEMPPEAERGAVEVLENVKDPITRKLLYMKLLIKDRVLWCTPELAAIAQDLEVTFRTNNDVSYYNYSNGVCGAVWEALGGAEKINPTEKLNF